MNPAENTDQLGSLLADLEASSAESGEVAHKAQRRPLSPMMRKIPVTLTLEVGAARMSLQEVMNINGDSVIELDTLAGEPLVIKVNGSPIGRAEVVVSGENYGLRVVELDDMELGSLGA